jgi:hypothetical protein
VSGWGLPPLTDWGQILYSAFRPETYGADPTGQSDSTSALVACRAAAVAAAAPVWLEGTYVIGSTQTLQAGEWLHLANRSSRIIGNFSGSRLFQSAGFGTPTKANDIRIDGPGRIGRSAIGQSGDILGIYGDRFTMLETVIDTFSQGRAFYGGGDHHYVWRVKAQVNDGLTGTGGWRFAVGRYSRMIQLDISSGDDALQLVPEGNGANSMFNVGDIEHTWYESCVGQSAAARGIAVLFVANGSGLGQMSTNIRYCGFRDCDVIGNARGLVIENLDSYGEISDIVLAGCSFDLTGAQTTFAEDCLVWENPANAAFFTGGHVLGPLRAITLEDLSITNSVAQQAPLRAIGAVENLVIERPKLYLPASASGCLIELTGGTTYRIKGGYLDGQSAAHPVVLIGAGGVLTNDAQVDGTRIVGIGSSQYAVNANAAPGFHMRRTRCEPGATQTLTKGFRTGATTTNARVRDNDFGALGATPFTDLGTGTQHSGNVGMGD